MAALPRTHPGHTLDVRKADITVEVIRGLVAAQFPQWAHLAVRPVEVDGWDNATFRLGPSMLARLPSADDYSAQVDKEQQWLPVLAPQLPVPIPVPLGRGAPSEAFPRPWSIYQWIDGDPLTDECVPDPTSFARELAGFLRALYECEPTGPEPGPHSFQRGGPVEVWDDQVRDTSARLDQLDREAVLAVWEAATAAPKPTRHVWTHGDVSGANLLVRNGHLAGVIDFGCSSVGDPACDLTIAWTFFEGKSREAFKAELPIEPDAWARARGWALWKALLHLAADLTMPGATRAMDQRVGWRISSAAVVDELIRDHREASNSR